MIIKPIQRSTNMMRRKALAIACVISSVLLASCGGGSDGTSSTESADGIQQAQGVTTSTGTVPGGWKGRAPKMELINGITVPPEPAPAVNNATLVGVDVNTNGVRDDVERRVAEVSQSAIQFQANLEYAKPYQGILSSPTLTDKTKIKQHVKMLLCVKSGDVTQALKSSIGDGGIIELTFNTPQRASALVAFNNISGIASAALEQNCD